MHTNRTETVRIPAWANGPGDPRDGSGTGNGGWTAGLVARPLGAGLDGCVAVSLRVPPPLDRTLQLTSDDAQAQLTDTTQEPPLLVATAIRADDAIEVPAAALTITRQQAIAARDGFPFRHHHPFPSCIACGTAERADLPSLRLHCGPVAGVTTTDGDGSSVPIFADTWTPDTRFDDPDEPGFVAVAACWSALDCPSAAPVADPDAVNPIVLARIAVRIERRPRIDEPLVLAAWVRSIDGRKRHTASAMVDAQGIVRAWASALWIEVRGS